VIGNYFIESCGQQVAGAAELTDHGKRQGVGAEAMAGKILMGDGIAPGIEHFEKGLALLVSGWGPGLHSIPELDIKSAEVGSDMSGRGILRVELAVQSQSDPEYVPAGVGSARGGLVADIVNGFGMKCAAKALEMAGNEHEIGMVDLQGGKAAAGLVAADGGVCRLNLVEGGAGVGIPALERMGGHGMAPERWRDIVTQGERPVSDPQSQFSAREHLSSEGL